MIPLLLWACLPRDATASAEPRRLYDGAARIYSLASVTVVYPAGPGQDVALNRLSAGRRAAHLTSKFGMRAEIAPDDEINEKQLADNLLLLGWDNKLLKFENASSPVASGEQRRRFLGTIPVYPGEDLIFGAPSPYNDERVLFFWSRIDPELDRHLVLPLVGSDFAVMRDFRVMHQGNFVRAAAWPPVRDPEAEMDHRGELTSPRPVVARSEHFALYGDLREGQARKILDVRERALARAIAALGDPGEGFTIDLHVYKDTETKDRITGVPDSSHTVPSRGEIHAIRVAARSSAPRNEVHVIAARQFGTCSLSALYEGLATSVSLPDTVSGDPLYAALLVKQNALPSVNAIIDEETLRDLVDEGTGIAAAGLLVSWLRERGGRELVARAYVSPQLDAAVLSSWLGLTDGSIDTAFRSWVEAQAARGETELAFRQAEAEARQAASQRNPAGEIAALTRALTYRSDHPETLYKLALAQMSSGLDDDAERTLRQLVSLEVGSADERYVTFGHFQLGTLHASRGEAGRAEAEMRQVLRRPDRHGSHRMAQEALDEMARKRDGSAREARP
jgi:hypothetical protein